MTDLDSYTTEELSNEITRRCATQQANSIVVYDDPSNHDVNFSVGGNRFAVLGLSQMAIKMIEIELMDEIGGLEVE